MDSKDMIRLQWEGNGSMRYDGKTQDVVLRFIAPEDRNATAEKIVCVKWGRQSGVWKAVVVGLEVDLEPCKHAAMSERVPEAKKKERLYPSLMSTRKVNEVNYTVLWCNQLYGMDIVECMYFVTHIKKTRL